MPQITIDLSEEAYASLSAQARFHEQALESYVAETLDSGVVVWQREALVEVARGLTRLQAAVQGQLQRDGVAPEVLSYETRQHLHRAIAHHVNQLQTMTDRFVPSLSSFGGPQLDLLEREALDVRVLISEVLATREVSKARTPEHRITIAISPLIPNVIFVGKRELLYVLSCLIRNALRFSPQGGNITITVALPNEEELLFTIADEGVGMSPDLLPQFGTIRPPAAGCSTLAATGHIRRHEGKLWATSPGEGKGTTVFFTLALGYHEGPHPASVARVIQEICQRLLAISEQIHLNQAHFRSATRIATAETIHMECSLLNQLVHQLEDFGAYTND